ncbi:uncharacterized protein G2W53_012855 [Senna tora]|uniref:Uncharacterized protein n=1 Tax=Senna tora TaxID=362788 RepID=A0A834TYA3_9FABA|nr:uncharacterized protein G2W53_012855 [Senna tora]
MPRTCRGGDNSSSQRCSEPWWRQQPWPFLTLKRGESGLPSPRAQRFSITGATHLGSHRQALVPQEFWP